MIGSQSVLVKKMSIDNAKIVEMSAYAPLTTSTIIDTIHVPVEDILILKDQDSFFKTLANIVRAETYIGKIRRRRTKMCSRSGRNRGKKHLMGWNDAD